MTSQIIEKAVRQGSTIGCVSHGQLFQHPLLEDAGASLPVEQRRQRAVMANRASALCAECPLHDRCLYDAVVKFDVSGVAAGTTPSQRAGIRARLGWRVEPESFDALLGVASSQHIEHDEIMRVRRANPQESLTQLADRLGCSLSTVKRHLRQERNSDGTPQSTRHAVPPSLEQVKQAYMDVVGDRHHTTSDHVHSQNRPALSRH